MARIRNARPKYRIDAFVSQAKRLASYTDIKCLCDQELDWIYATYTMPTMPHKVINDYRRALREHGLVEPYLQRPVVLMEQGEILAEERYLPGYFREREAYIAQRLKADNTRLKDALSYKKDVRMLDGREYDYLEKAISLATSRVWEETAVGLLMATGRRTMEIGITAQMHPLDEKPYWVSYSGQLKTRSEARAQEALQIPILIPTSIACQALERVQATLRRQYPDGRTFFDDVIGRTLRHHVQRTLHDLFPGTAQLSPRTLRNCYVALALEAVTPNGIPLCEGDADHVLGQLLGHKPEHFRARDHYKNQMLPRLRRNIVLPE